MCLFIRMLTYHLVERFINVITIIYSRPYIFISRNISESLSIFICLISPPLGCQRPSLKPILPSKSNLVYVKKKKKNCIECITTLKHILHLDGTWKNQMDIFKLIYRHEFTESCRK